MAIPQPVVDVLNSFSIVSPVSGAQVPAATRLTPALNTTDLQAAFDALNADEILAKVDLDIDFKDFKLKLEPSDGKTNLDVVLKAVEFAEPAETQASAVPVDAQALGKLPHLTPSTATVGYVLNISNRVLGLLGTAEGTIKLVESLTGSLLGTITGDIKRALPSVDVSVTLRWAIQDASGRDLTATEVVNLGTDAVPVWVLLPPFVEFTGGPPTTTERRISARITVAVGSEQVTRTVGPVSVQVPQIPVPTLVAFTEHTFPDPRQPGMILIGVPGNSAVGPLTNIDSILSPISTLFGTLTPLLVAGSAAFGAFTAAVAATDRLRGLLNRTFFVSTDEASGLWFGPWPLGPSFEDFASSLVMIGPPGRRLRVYNSRRDFWTWNFVERHGSLNITLGPTGIVDIPDFTTGMPPAATPGGFGAFDSTVTVGMAGTPPLGNFNDVLSAYKFLAPGEA